MVFTRPLGDDSETVASYYVDELRRAVAPFRVDLEIIRDYDGKHLEDAANATEMKVGLVRQQERHLHNGGEVDVASTASYYRLLTLARNDGFS